MAVITPTQSLPYLILGHCSLILLEKYYFVVTLEKLLNLSFLVRDLTARGLVSCWQGPIINLLIMHAPLEKLISEEQEQ